MSNTAKPSVTVEVAITGELATRVRAAADLRGGEWLPLAAVVAALLTDAVAGLAPSSDAGICSRYARPDEVEQRVSDDESPKPLAVDRRDL